MRKEIEKRGDHDFSVFYDDNDKEIMEIGFPGSDCWWFFANANPVDITKDMEIYDLIADLMDQDYDFPPYQTFIGEKTPDKLVWYSDCYCNPSDQSSVDKVSCLTIQRIGEIFRLQCANKTFDGHGKTNYQRGVGFGACGNGGRVAINKKTGMNLGDDFIRKINNPLQGLTRRPKSKVKKPVQKKLKNE